mgnify:CR=1 FL=1
MVHSINDISSWNNNLNKVGLTETENRRYNQSKDTIRKKECMKLRDGTYECNGYLIYKEKPVNRGWEIYPRVTSKRYLCTLEYATVVARKKEPGPLSPPEGFVGYFD